MPTTTKYNSNIYVGSDLYSWSDFCVFTTKGLSITRIFPDVEWKKEKNTMAKIYWQIHETRTN